MAYLILHMFCILYILSDSSLLCITFSVGSIINHKNRRLLKINDQLFVLMVVFVLFSLHLRGGGEGAEEEG